MPASRPRGWAASLAFGVASHIATALLLAPRRRGAWRRTHKPSTQAGDFLLEIARAGVHAGHWMAARATATQSDLPPDERLSQHIRTELEHRGIWSPRVDVTAVDGTVFLRGREADSIRADTIAGIARRVPGVVDVVDDIRRE